MKTIAIFIAVAFLLWPSGIESFETVPTNIQDYMLPAVKAKTELVIIEIQKKPPSLIGNGQCIDYVKYKLGIKGEQWISPKNIWNNYEDYGLIKIKEPLKGSLIVTEEGPVWHIAFIESVTQNVIQISEQNYVYRKYSERTLERDADQIQGYFMIGHQLVEVPSLFYFQIFSFLL